MAEAPCYAKCGSFLKRRYADDFGIDVNVSTVRPLFPTGYEALDMRCPHDVLWYAEPTAEQRLRWAEEQVP